MAFVQADIASSAGVTPGAATTGWLPTMTELYAFVIEEYNAAQIMTLRKFLRLIMEQFIGLTVRSLVEEPAKYTITSCLN